MSNLNEIQNKLKVPKGNYNAFGKYKYRSCEDILETLKPILKEYNATLVITDDIIPIGVKFFLKSTAIITVNDKEYSCNGYAEMSEHKGMSSEQATGTASSYARKYALNGLFLIDETEADPDHSKKQKLTSNCNAFKQAVERKVPIEKMKEHYAFSSELEKEYLNLIK